MTPYDLHEAIYRSGGPLMNLARPSMDPRHLPGWTQSAASKKDGNLSSLSTRMRYSESSTNPYILRLVDRFTNSVATRSPKIMQGITGNLEVLVIGASNIKDVQTLGRQDPGCELELSGQKMKTKTATDMGRNPVWNARLTFVSINSAYATELIARVYNRNVLSSDELIGSARCSLARVYASRTSEEVRLPLATARGTAAGELQLLLTFKPFSTAPTPGGPQPGYAANPAAAPGAYAPQAAPPGYAQPYVPQYGQYGQPPPQQAGAAGSGGAAPGMPPGYPGAPAGYRPTAAPSSYGAPAGPSFSPHPQPQAAAAGAPYPPPNAPSAPTGYGAPPQYGLGFGMPPGQPAYPQQPGAYAQSAAAPYMQQPGPQAQGYGAPGGSPSPPPPAFFPPPPFPPPMDGVAYPPPAGSWPPPPAAAGFSPPYPNLGPAGYPPSYPSAGGYQPASF